MIKSSDGRAAVLRALDQSGLSMAEFCRLRGLAYTTVASWRSQARRVGGRFVEVEKEVAPVSASPEAMAGGALCAELVLPGGAVLRVYQLAGKGGAR
jgi:transposase-like protein